LHGATTNYELLKQNPEHPPLQFKSVSSGRFRSVRIGIHYRALGIPVPEVQWFWIRSHAAAPAQRGKFIVRGEVSGIG
jgi:hypothetical protein